MKERKMRFPLSKTDAGRIEKRLARAARHERIVLRESAKKAELHTSWIMYGGEHV